MKILSVNLWFEKYGHKTLAELASFSHFGYETYVATVSSDEKNLNCIIYQVKGHKSILLLKKAFSKKPFGLTYLSIFKYLFSYCAAEQYNLIYFRRLMSKLFFAALYIKKLSKTTPIIYEIPTYPFDIPANRLYALRDFLELQCYHFIEKYISVTTACVYQNAPVNPNWLIFENGIDISNYSRHSVPALTDTISMLLIANMAIWHRCERILYAIKDYHGPYKLHLIVGAPPSKDYDEMKKLAGKLEIAENVEFHDFLPIKQINEMAENIHLAVGQLSLSDYGVMSTHALKHKDYCALGLPLFSTCQDDSFPSEYPYYYFIEDTDAALDLDTIIQWYKKIRLDPNHRDKMYEYAVEHLQYHDYVRNILNECEKKSL